MKSIPTDVSESVRRRNPHLYGGGKPDPAIRGAPQPKRIRQDPKPLMNKLEAAWLAQLETRFPGVMIWKQALKWRLGNGIFYKPDFAVFEVESLRYEMPSIFTCWEVKGPHAFRGGFENLKVAASLYPEVKWILVWKDNGEWKEQDVLP